MEEAQKSLKILMLIRNFDFGGAENHVCSLANALVKNGHEVWLLTGGGRQQHLLDPKVRHIRHRFYDELLVLQMLWLFGLVKYHQFDLIHAHQRLMILAGNLAGVLTKIPVVATVHGRIRYDLRSTFVRKHTSGVIAVCENSLVGLLRDPLLKEKANYIPNGVVFKDPDYHSINDAFHLYYISRTDRRHFGLLQSLIIKVMPVLLAEYPSVRLFIVGEGTHYHALQQLLQTEKAASAAKVVQLLGYRADLDPVFADASLVFGVGRVAIEAIAHAVPVFSLKTNHLGEIICDQNVRHFQFGNFVDVNGPVPNTEAVLDKLRDFFQNRKYYNDQALRLQQQLREVYSIETVVEQTLNLYNKLIINK